MRSISRSIDGDVLNVRYSDPILADSIIPPGRRESSRFPSFLTDAKAFDLSGTATIFGVIIPLGASDISLATSPVLRYTLRGIAAPSAVPEPASMALLAAGLLGFVFRNRGRTAT